MAADDEERRLRSAALQNSKAILLAQERAEQELVHAKEALERKTQELAHSLAMMRATLESTTDGILVTDETGRVTDFNEKFIELWGFPRETMEATTHQKLQELIAAQLKDSPGYRNATRKVYESWPPQTFDLLELVNGRAIERHSKIQTLGGSPVGRVWSFRDISDRKLAEEKLQQQREWFRVTLSSIGDAVITTDTEARVTYLNPVAEVMTGWKNGEATGQPLEKVFNIINEQTREPVANPVSKALREGIVVGLANHTALIARDGRITAIEDSAAPILDGKENIVGAVMVFHDVTDRRRAEGLLRENEQRLRATFEQAAVGMATAGLDGRFEQVNRRFSEILGYSPEELGKLTFYELTFPEDMPQTEAVMKRLLADEISNYVLEKRYVRKDGRLVWSLTTVTRLKDESGKPTGFIGVIEDITQRREAEEALRDNEERYRLMGQVMPHLFWITDAQGRPVYFNERWFAYTGLTEAEAFAPNRPSILHPDDRQRSIDAWNRCVKTGEPFECEYRIRRHDGACRWFVARGAPLRDDAGRIVRWYGSSTDVHEQKVTAEALREQYTVTEQLNDVARALATELDLSKIVQIITDAGTRITRAQFGAFFHNHVDEKGESYALYTLSGVLREAFEKFPMPRATAVFGPTFRGEGVIRLDDVRRDERFGKNVPYHGMPKGHLPVVSYLAVPVFSRAGEVLGGLFFGHPEPAVFTERDEKIIVGIAAQASAAMDNARLYQAEQQARGAAERANKAKDDFLATLSHELRNPLNPVLLIASEAAQNAGLPPEVRDDFEMIQRNVELEARLIDDLLDLTRITRRKMSLELRPVEVHAVLREAIAIVSRDAETKAIAITSTFAAEQSRVMGDPARLQQIFWNVLRNAVKFTPQGGKVTIRTRNGPKGNEFVLTVVDTGIGMTPGEITKIFEAFTQGDHASSTGAHRFGGLGLGLAIAQYLVQMHGGRIEAKSDGLDQGSTFLIVLPLLDCVEFSTGNEKPRAVG